MYLKFQSEGSREGWQTESKEDSLGSMSIETLSAVVAVARNGTIGRNNSLPWKLRTDLQRFKRLTMGHCLLMGRKTYQSIGKPLPGRQTIVLSRQKGLAIPGVEFVGSLAEAMQTVPEGKIGFVVGGAEVYRLAMPMVRDLYFTCVLADIAGDASFDPFDLTGYDCIEQEYVPADQWNDWPTEFRHWRARS